MSAEVFKAAERVLIATANGAYQGVLVAVLAGLALRLFFRTNAATRHAVWFAVLLFVAALIPAHLLLSLRSHREAQATATVTPGWAFLANTDQGFVSRPNFSEGQSEQFDPASIDTPPPHGEGVLSTAESQSTETALEDPVSADTKEKASMIGGVLKPFTRNVETAIHLPPSISLFVVLAWAVVVGIRGGLIAGRIHGIRQTKKMSSAPSERLQGLFNQLRASLATKRNARLKISNEHRTAVVLGFVHPVVLLPMDMDCDGNEAEVEHVVRHELAHIKRRDDWSNLLQQIIQAVLFFHPAVWWISSTLSLEREIACDDHVLEANGKPRSYALTLANIASRINHTGQLLAPGVSNNNSHLQQRINMILNTQRDRSPRLARTRLGFFTMATAILAFLIINAGPRLVQAQSSAPGPIATQPNAAALPAGQNVLVAAAAPTAMPPGAIAVSTLPSPAALPLAADVQVSVAPAPVVAVSPTVNLALGDTASSDLTPDFPGDAESGPRPKPAPSEDEPTPGALIAPVPAVPAVPPAPGARPAKRHLSIEERLDRIERILEELQARGGKKGDFRGYYGLQAPGGQSYGAQNYYGPGVAYATPMKPGGGGGAGGADYTNKRATLEAQAAADQTRAAMDEVRRAVEMGQRAAERAKNDMAKLKSQDLQRLQDELRAAESENSEKELNALRDARESLRSQMQTLEQQIKRLEEERSRMNKSPNNNRSDDEPREKPAPEAR